MVLPIEETISDLSAPERPLRNSALVNLSDMNSEEILLLELAWPKVELQRRRQIMNRLVEMAEDNTELNFDAVFRLGLEDSDAGVRSKAIEGLWENEEPSLIDSLARLLHQDSSKTVQAAAALSLGRFAMMAELGKLRPGRASQVSDSLTRVLDDKNRPAEVRRRALEAAAPLSISRVKDAIRAAYEGDDVKLKTSAIYAMGKSCDPSWLSALLNELDSEIGELRYEAAVACGELGEKEAVPHLIRLINDKDVDVQLASIQALAKIGGADARKSLKRCLTSTNAAVRETAEQGLSQMEAEEDTLSFQIRPK